MYKRQVQHFYIKSKGYSFEHVKQNSELQVIIYSHYVPGYLQDTILQLVVLETIETAKFRLKSHRSSRKDLLSNGTVCEFLSCQYYTSTLRAYTAWQIIR